MNAPAYTILPHRALRLAAELMGKEGKAKGSTWKEISVKEHLDHAMNHIVLHLEGDRTEKHLVNATCRIMMASEIALVGENIYPTKLDLNRVFDPEFWVDHMCPENPEDKSNSQSFRG